VALELVHETHSTSVDNERGIATGWPDGNPVGDRTRYVLSANDSSSVSDIE